MKTHLRIQIGLYIPPFVFPMSAWSFADVESAHLYSHYEIFLLLNLFLLLQELLIFLLELLISLLKLLIFLLTSSQDFVLQFLNMSVSFLHHMHGHDIYYGTAFKLSKLKQLMPTTKLLISVLPLLLLPVQLHVFPT